MRSIINRMLATVLATSTLMQGCSAMSNDGVLKFSTHDLGITCYGGVTKVWLLYAGSDHELCTDRIARDKTPADAKRMPGVRSGAYRSFAGPVEMKWTSRDGSQLAYTLDLDAVFKDRTIEHGQDPARIDHAKPWFGGEPTIIVEFDDRSINVYLAGTLLLKSAEPGNTRLEDIDLHYLAFSRTL